MTKSEDLVDEDLTVNIVGDIQPSYTIDQENCTVKFAVYTTAGEPPADIVATIGCGDAEPVDVTLHYVSPTTESITVQNASTAIAPTYASYTYRTVTRNSPPYWSGSDVEASMDADNEKFDITIEQKYNKQATHGKYIARLGIKQLEPCETVNHTLTISCGDATPVNVVVRAKTS